MFFSVLNGVILSFFIILAQRYNLIDDNNHSNLVSPRLAVLSSFLALIGFIASTIYNILCENRIECYELLSYTSIIPVRIQNIIEFQNSTIYIVKNAITMFIILI